MAGRLTAKTAQWHTILQEVMPQLIIADFAPTLRLAIGNKVPVVVVGNGYTVPPPGQLLPPIRHRETSIPALSRANEGRLLAAVNVVRARLRGEAIDFFSDLFSGGHTFVCTLPEFDPYRRFRCGPNLWPFNIPDVPLGPPVVQRRGPRIFVYLPANHPALPSAISALNDLKLASEIYVSGMTAHELAKRCSQTVRIHSKPAESRPSPAKHIIADPSWWPGLPPMLGCWQAFPSWCYHLILSTASRRPVWSSLAWEKAGPQLLLRERRTRAI